MTVSVALDVDPGIDDALALLLALTSPEIRVALITTVAGNGPLHLTTRNALRVLDYLGAAHIPVAAGASQPLEKPLHGALEYHGCDALGGLPLPESGRLTEPRGAEDMLFDFAAAAPGDRIIIATGPLTNVARAFQRHEQLPAMLKELIIMGGAFRLTRFGGGNQTPHAEFNIWQDPDAAYAVFRADVPITIVGLDVTSDPAGALDSSDLTRLRAASTRQAALAADLVGFALCRHQVCHMHDPLAVAAALDPSLFDFVSGCIDVVTRDDAERGKTTIHAAESTSIRKSPTRVAAKVDGPRFKQLVLSRMLSN